MKMSIPLKMSKQPGYLNCLNPLNIYYPSLLLTVKSVNTSFFCSFLFLNFEFPPPPHPKKYLNILICFKPSNLIISFPLNMSLGASTNQRDYARLSIWSNPDSGSKLQNVSQAQSLIMYRIYRYSQISDLGSH